MCAEGGGKRPAVLRSLRSAGASVAAGLILTIAGPKGSARAAEQLDAPTRAVASKHLVDREPPLAAIGLRTRTRSKAPPRQYAEDELVLDKLGTKLAEQFTSRDFIFSESLTARSPLQEELEELETFREEAKAGEQLRGIFTLGGSALFLYAGAQGLSGVARWFENQEAADIAEEMELTGQYISVDAGDVEGAIDPKTGKNITVSKGVTLDGASPAATPDAGADAAAPPAEKKTPWLLRVLGIDSEASDSDDFWEPPAAAQKPPPVQPPGGDGAPAAGADGAPGADGAGDGGEPEGQADDSSNFDTLDDLLG